MNANNIRAEVEIEDLLLMLMVATVGVAIIAEEARTTAAALGGSISTFVFAVALYRDC